MILNKISINLKLIKKNMKQIKLVFQKLTKIKKISYQII